MNLGLREFVLSAAVAVGVAGCKNTTDQPTPPPEVVTPAPLVEEITPPPPPLTDAQTVEKLTTKFTAAADRCVDIFRHGSRHPDDDGRTPITFQLITDNGAGTMTKENCAASRVTDSKDSTLIKLSPGDTLKVQKAVSYKRFVDGIEDHSIVAVQFIVDTTTMDGIHKGTTATIDNLRVASGIGFSDGIIDLSAAVYIPDTECEGTRHKSTVGVQANAVNLDGTVARALNVGCEEICPNMDKITDAIQRALDESKPAIARTAKK